MPFQPFHPGFKWGVTLPGPDGPFDMPAYEHFARPSTICRYFATLQQRVEAAKNERRADNSVASAENSLASSTTAPAYPTRDDYDGYARGKGRGTSSPGRLSTSGATRSPTVSRASTPPRSRKRTKE